ncbi:hypothetical protein C8J56DRAFT_472146 [Mycena floridula]|nr:hypothetical protein C8J56DRAFT_472146 [Mycena floridula]
MLLEFWSNIFQLFLGAWSLSVTVPNIIVNEGPQKVVWTRDATDPVAFQLQLRQIRDDGSQFIPWRSAFVEASDSSEIWRQKLCEHDTTIQW